MIRTPSIALLISVALGLSVPGCQPAAPTGTAPPATVAVDAHDHEDHGHPSEGPHHGVLVELGSDEYHAEVVHDDASGSVTVYLLDSSAKNSVSTEATEIAINIKHGETPEQFKLPAISQPGDTAGKSSMFSLTSQELAEHLHEPASAARLSITINETPYSGAIPHEGHAGHDHGHSHK